MKKKIYKYALEYLSLTVKFASSDPIKQKEATDNLKEMIEYLATKGYFVRWSYSNSEFVIVKGE